MYTVQPEQCGLANANVGWQHIQHIFRAGVRWSAYHQRCARSTTPHQHKLHLFLWLCLTRPGRVWLICLFAACCSPYLDQRTLHNISWIIRGSKRLTWTCLLWTHRMRWARAYTYTQTCLFCTEPVRYVTCMQGINCYCLIRVARKAAKEEKSLADIDSKRTTCRLKRVFYSIGKVLLCLFLSDSMRCGLTLSLWILGSLPLGCPLIYTGSSHTLMQSYERTNQHCCALISMMLLLWQWAQHPL